MDWFITDHLGSTKMLIDQNGQHRFTGDDDPFGINLRSFGDKDSHRYTGQILDEEQGLYYYGARYYLPEVGRFITGDPLAINDSIYVYTGNIPTMMIDLDGKAPDIYYFNKNGDLVDQVKDKNIVIFIESTDGKTEHQGRTYRQVDTKFIQSFMSTMLGETAPGKKYPNKGGEYQAAQDLAKAAINAYTRFGGSEDESWYNKKMHARRRIDAIDPSDKPGVAFAKKKMATDKGIESLRSGNRADAFRGVMSALSNMTPSQIGDADMWIAIWALDKQIAIIIKGGKIKEENNWPLWIKQGGIMYRNSDGQHDFFREK